MTYRESRLRRADRLDGAAERNAERADQRLARGTAALDAIPFGQPIITGRGSATVQDVRYRERARDNMAAGFALSRQADDQASRAAEIRAQAAGAIYRDDPDALDALGAKLADLEAQRASVTAYNKTARKGSPDLDLLHPAQRRHADSTGPLAAYVGSNLSGNISRVRERIALIEARAALQVAADEAAAAGVAPDRRFPSAVDDDVLQVLAACTFDGPVAHFAGRVDRDLYRKVALAVGTIGGRWDRTRGGFLFVGDAKAIVTGAVTAAAAAACDVCDAVAVDCIAGEVYLCAEHLVAWHVSQVDDPGAFVDAARPTTP